MVSETNEDGRKDPKQNHTQFLPGQSGNPKGRPKRSAQFFAALGQRLERKRKVRIGGRVRSVPTLELILLLLRAKALQGNKAAIDLVARIEEKSGQLEKHQSLTIIARPAEYFLGQGGRLVPMAQWDQYTAELEKEEVWRMFHPGVHRP